MSNIAEIQTCQVCGENKEKATMQIVPTDCWSCHAPMKLALILIAGTLMTSEDFTKEHVELARSKGVILQERLSQTSGIKYLANICPSCNNFIGDFFIHDYLYLPAEDISAGFHCVDCLYRKKFGPNS